MFIEIDSPGHPDIRHSTSLSPAGTGRVTHAVLSPAGLGWPSGRVQAIEETQARSLGGEVPLEKEMEAQGRLHPTSRPSHHPHERPCAFDILEAY